MKQNRSVRLLSLLLVVILLVGTVAPAGAVGSAAVHVTFTQVDNSAVSADLRSGAEEQKTETAAYADTDMVRVSIFLAERATIDAGFSAAQIAQNEQAMAYRADLQQQQAAVTASIEKATGAKLRG